MADSLVSQPVQPNRDPRSNRTPSSTGTQASKPQPHLGRPKYANPEELPSCPSVGVKENSAAASAAASLGWANQKPVEPWKPASSAPASAAAAMARDYKMTPLREPERSSAGHLAARMAAGSAQKQAPGRKSPPSAWGNSAANVAFEAARASSPTVTHKVNREITRHGSLHAARASVSGTRIRSKSTPYVAEHRYPDQANAAANALSAATIAHRPTVRVATREGGAVPYTTMNRQMFTANPPVKPEVDEQQHADVLHASAVAMAKRMFVQQQKMIDTTKHTDLRRTSSFSRHGASSPESVDDEPLPRFPNLQEAAYRLAQERLGKLHEEHQKNREFQEYYGSPGVSSQRTKFGTIRGKLTRKRSSSDGDLIDDRRKSQQIRRQMSMLSTKLSKVDEQQRAHDREAVINAAQRNVRAQLEGMDQKLYAETGRIAPRMLTEWELKAHTAAQERADARKSDNFGKINLGAGKFIDRNEVDDIAARIIKPLVDDINQRAEEERERQLTERLEAERRKEQAEKEKVREREIKDIHRKLKEQEREEAKERKAEMKQEAKAKKDEERATKAEEKRRAKVETGNEGKLKLKEASKPAVMPTFRRRVSEGDHRAAPRATATATPERALRLPDRQGARSPPLEDEDSPPPAAKMRNWLKSRFSRPRARSSSAVVADTEPGVNEENGTAASKRGGFIGGIRLHRRGDDRGTSVEQRDGSGSMREVALATAGADPPRRDGTPVRAGTPGLPRPEEGGSGVTPAGRRDSSETEEFVEAEEHGSSAQVTPPQALPDPAGPRGGGNLVRESRFSELIE